MAVHVRQQIREAIASTVTGLATTGNRVFASRVYPLADADLPALSVYVESETSEVSTVHGPPMLERRARVIVEGAAKANADLDNVLDRIASEVEVALNWPVAALDPIAKGFAFQQTEIDMTGEAERPTGSIRLIYECQYFVMADAPDVALH